MLFEKNLVSGQIDLILFCCISCLCYKNYCHLKSYVLEPNKPEAFIAKNGIRIYITHSFSINTEKFANPEHNVGGLIVRVLMRFTNMWFQDVLKESQPEHVSVLI